MKSILIALCLISAVFADTPAAVTTVAPNITILDLDSSSSSNLPLTAVNGTTSATLNSATTFINATANQSYALTWKAGVPLVAEYAYTGNAYEYVVLPITIGNRAVKVGFVNGSSSAMVANGHTFTAADTCGSNYVNGATGVVYVFLNPSCQIFVNQTSSVSGAVQFSADTLTATQQQQVCTGVLSAASTTGVTCTVTGTSSGSTIVYFQLAVPAGTSAASLSTIASNVQSAISAKSIAVDGTTTLGGYASTVTPSATAGTTAPSTAAAAQISAAAKSHSRMVVIAGVFSTVLAAFFGLAF